MKYNFILLNRQAVFKNLLANVNAEKKFLNCQYFSLPSYYIRLIISPKA